MVKFGHVDLKGEFRSGISDAAKVQAVRIKESSSSTDLGAKNGLLEESDVEAPAAQQMAKASTAREALAAQQMAKTSMANEKVY